MITYWAPQRESFLMRHYLEHRGAPIAHRFGVRHYEELTPEIRLEGSAQIFSALDRLTPTGRELVAEIWDRLAEAAPSWARLNDPRRVLLRQPFLAAMEAAGLNAFRVHPTTSSAGSLRFPVFIRERDGHEGPLTRLLESEPAARRALRSLRLLGHRAESLIFVEYLDTADQQGRFRKYSAYRVGSMMVRAHMMVSDDWMVKSGSSAPSRETVLEELEYLHGDAHEEWLWQVFALAGIDFGRIDYGTLNGRPQAWEINLNPTIGAVPGKPRQPQPPETQAMRDEGRAFAHGRLRAAFLALDQGESPPGPLAVTLPPRLLQAVRREWAAAARRHRATEMLRRALHSPVIGWPARAVYARVSPKDPKRPR